MHDQGLGDLLSRFPTRFQPLSPLALLGGGGGLSGARLWRFRSQHGELLLRAWPRGQGRAHIEQVHRWLSMSHDLGFIPIPIRDRSRRSVQGWGGTLWDLTPWMAGSPDLVIPPRLDHVRLAFTGLARLHQRLSCEQAVGVSAGLQQRYHAIRQLIEGGFRTLEAAILHSGESDLSRRQTALGWLSFATILAPRLLDPLARASTRRTRIQPTVRDARPEHFLFEGDALSGLVDFGAMGVDSVAGDLARLIGAWFDGDTISRREALASYEHVRPLDSTESELIAAFEAGTAILIGERWVRWHYIEHRVFDDPQAVSSGLARGLKSVERLVRQQSGV